MALRQLVDLPPFTPAVAGQIATIDIPASGTYYNVTLEYRESGTLVTEANMILAIEEINVKINGESVRRYSGEDLITLNKFAGVAYQNGYLPIFFAEPWGRNPASEDVFAWGMANVSTFQIDVKIATGRTAPTIAATCSRTNENRPLGAIKKIRKFNIPVASTGINNLQTLPKTESYVACHAKSTNIADVQVSVDNVKILKATKDQIAQEIKNSPLFDPQTGWTHIPFQLTGRMEDLLPMRVPVRQGSNEVVQVQSFQIDFNMSAATSFNLLTETVGTL